MSTHNNYERFQEAKCQLSVGDIVNAFDYIESLIGYVPRDNKLHEYYDEVIDPLMRFVEDTLTKAKCPHCGRDLYCSDVEGYEYVCAYCDENFYECEVE